MKRQKSQEELLFDKLLTETKEREKELFSRHREALVKMDKEEAELQQMQEDLNKNERQILKNLEAEMAQLKGRIEDLELSQEAELELMDEEIEKTGQGYNEKMDKRAEHDKKIEKAKAVLAPDLEKLELLIKKATKAVKEKELKYLERLQVHLIGNAMFRNNLELLYKSKLADLERLYGNVSRVEAVSLGISQKSQEIGALQDEIFKLEGGPDTSAKRIQQSRGRILTTGEIK